MNTGSARNIFFILSVILLAFMLLMSRKAGVSCDEVLHYNHSVNVLNYFSSAGKDTSALNTPVTHLKYYGQSYDNITTLLIRLFNIEDIYGFRHIMSTLAGWLTALIAALFAIWIGGYGAGIFVLLLFAVSPTFTGHSLNNLKDIPFALAYISGLLFISRFLNSRPSPSRVDILLLMLSIAFCFSIRPGGVILIFYLFFFLACYYFYRLIARGRQVIREAVRKILIALAVSAAAWFLGLILWPYALQDPVRNPVVSFGVMTDFPDTFRQIFEGRYDWSDFMPWYYLPKSMAITIPLIVLCGFILSPLFIPAFLRRERGISILILLAGIILPVLFVIINRSNLYNGWRHFLFVYPAIVIMAGLTYAEIFRILEKLWRKSAFTIALIAASLHPLFFMAKEPEYSYIYYNQIVGGISGAFGNYETDYYFVNQREASEWLIEYLREKRHGDTVKVGSNFSAQWYFRKYPLVRNTYFRNEERSMHDWDYAITTNRFITPHKLKNGLWPSEKPLKVIYAGDIPVGEITERKSGADYSGWLEMEKGNYDKAVILFSEALEKIDNDEMIFYNFAVALNRTGDSLRADSALMRCLDLNPGFEPALMYLGNIASRRGDREKAERYYRELIRINRKYDEAYKALEEINE